MTVRIHEAMYGAMPEVRPPPVVGLAALLFIPSAFWICTLVVHHAAENDFLGIDILRAFWWAHGAASTTTLALSIWSLRRHERPLWLGYLLMLVAGGWLPFTLAAGR